MEATAQGCINSNWWAPAQTGLMTTPVLRHHVSTATDTDQTGAALRVLRQRTNRPHAFVAPLGQSQRRAPRPKDVAILGTLGSGPLGTAVLAAPWAVGLGAAGALANPGLAPRPPIALGPAAVPGSAPMGVPQFSPGTAHPYRLHFSTNAGIPWGAGHWPTLPRLGWGGQGAWYTRRQASVCVDISAQDAQKIAARVQSWWWPLCHALGVDVGPLALRLPPLQSEQPLSWLRPEDTATLVQERVYFVSVGMVMGWLRFGPQLLGHHSTSLQIHRLAGNEIEVTMHDGHVGRQRQMLADLPTLATAYADDGQVTLRARTWRLNLLTAAGSATYHLLRHTLMTQTSFVLPQPLQDHIHTGAHHGKGVALYAPWTLLKAHPQAWARMDQVGQNAVEHGAVRRCRVRIESERESFAHGHDAWRLSVEAGPKQDTAQGALHAVALHYETQLQRPHRPTRNQLYYTVACLYLGLPDIPLPNTALQSGKHDDGLNVSVRALFAQPTLWQNLRRRPPLPVVAKAQRLGLTGQDLQTLLGALQEATPVLTGAIDPMRQTTLTTLLKKWGPAGMAVLHDWLGEHCRVEVSVSYIQTADLVNSAWQRLAANSGGAAAPSACDAAAQLTTIDTEIQRLGACPFMALDNQGGLTAALDQLQRLRAQVAPHSRDAVSLQDPQA